MLYDGDEAGIHAATRSAEMLLQEGMTVKVCLLPDGDDPDSFARKHTAQEYRQFIDDNATDYIRFKTNLLLKQAGNDPLKRGEAIREITKAIAIIPEAIMRDVFIKEAADMLGIEEKRMVGYVADQRKTNREAEDKRKAVAAQTPATSQNQDAMQGPVSPQGEMPDAPPMPPIDDLPNRDMSPNREEVQAGNELISVNSQSAKALYKYEFHIMQLVVRYGEKVMCELTDEEGNNTPVTVIDFVSSTLEQDDMVLTNPLFREMLKLAVEHQHETDFSAERYFINHPNTAISQMALELVSERYQLSKYHSKYQTIVADDQRLQELSTEITISYKYAIVNESLQEVLRQLQDPAIAIDGLKCAQTIKRYTELREIQAELAKRLGERVVLTF